MVSAGMSPASSRRPPATAARLRRIPRTLPRLDGSRVLLAALLVACAVTELVAGEARAIVLPILAMLICVATYAATLYRRDGILPIFEPASFAMAATFVYGSYPLVNFIAGGLRWSPFSDNRLQQVANDPRDVAAFGWRYALYLATFVVTYLLSRGAGVRTTAMREPSRATVISIVGTAFLAWALLAVVARVFGIEYSAGYADLTAGSVRTISSLPLFVAQITQNVASIQLLMWELIVALLLLRWRNHMGARVVLVAFLLFVAADVIVTRGSRSQLVLLLMATGIFYHRLVRPLKLVVMTVAGCGLLAGFLAFGILRDFRDYDSAMSNHGDVTFLTAGNEFQAILGTPFDLRERLRTGQIVQVPPQIYWADLLALVPSQLLPFEKIDPGLWYLKVAGIDNSGVVFGLMAQVVLGLDWLELILRGMALALVLALLQRWYLRRVESFWPTMLMMYLSVWMYYTIRQSTFSFLYVVVYRFLPTMIVVEVLRLLLTRVSRPVRAAAASATRFARR
jgi:hypothetical protein